MSEINAVKPYEAFNWQDHAVERQRTYRMTQNADDTITLTPEEGEVYQQGTPINALRLNHMEKGISETNALAISTAEKQQEMQKTLDGNAWITLTFLAANWAQAETGRYTQTTEAEGVTADTRCRCIEIDMGEATEDTIEGLRSAWALIDNAQTVDGGVMLTAFDAAPEIDFSVIVEVVM